MQNSSTAQFCDIIGAMTPEEIESYRYKDGISPADYEWRERRGFMHLPIRFGGRGPGVWCMNCNSEVILIEGPRENCPNDECYNFARGIDFWLTGEEWLRDCECDYAAYDYEGFTCDNCLDKETKQ